ncbi:unnamed protein product [Arabidopsis halleri]
MALLGSGDKNASEIMSMVLGDFFRKCDSSTIIGNAIIYECIRCISCILPNTKLFEVVISVTKEGVKFSTAGDIGTANIVLRQNTIVDFIDFWQFCSLRQKKHRNKQISCFRDRWILKLINLKYC